MALPLDKLGTTDEERVEVISPDRARAYAGATNHGAGQAADRHAYAFEATSQGDLVVVNGWAEVED